MGTWRERFTRAFQSKGDRHREAVDAGADDLSHKTAWGLEPGALVAGRYRLDAELGRGGMGIVYRATDVENVRLVAVKVLNPTLTSDRAREHFMHEARIMSSLEHPHIAKVLDFGTVDIRHEAPVPFTVMEYIEGTNIHELGDLSIAQIIDITIQICQALEYAHDKGVVHRDLKPENVLVERAGMRYFAKLADLGLAESRRETTTARDNVLEGSVFYLAPEVIAGKPASAGADLYALGVMLYEMLTGHVPFSDYDEHAILSQHLDQVAAPPSQSRHGIPPELDAIVLRLLSKEAAARFASAAEVRLALEGVGESMRSPVTGNIPRALTSAAASLEKLERLVRMVEQARLVTLVGGVSGARSQLAVLAGWRLVSSFSDGAWLIDLTDCAEPACVPKTVASVFGVHEEQGRALTVSLREYFREKNMLLIIRGCERVGGPCAQLVEMILDHCPDVRMILCTQRALDVTRDRSALLDVD